MAGDAQLQKLSPGDHYDLVIAVRNAMIDKHQGDDGDLLMRRFGINAPGSGYDGPSWGEALLDADEGDVIELATYLGIEIPGVTRDEGEAIPAAADIDAYSELVAAETALREVVRTGIGSGWINDFDEEKKVGLEAKRTEEDRRRDGVTISQDLLDYTEAYHLESLILKHWDDVRPILQDKKRTEVHLKLMLSVRNTVAHARPVAPFERHLLAGVAGQIQNLIAIHRSSSSGPDAYYASINSVRDSFGDELGGTGKSQSTTPRLSVGQTVTFECSATDPYDRGIEWTFRLWGNSSAYPSQALGTAHGAVTTFEWKVTTDHVGEGRSFEISMSNDSPYRRGMGRDDSASFRYHVNPPIPPRR